MITTSRICVWSMLNALVETKAIRNLLVRWVPKHRFAAADHHGYVAGGDMETIHQVLYLGVAFEVYVGVGVAVAHQELFNPKCTGGMGRADEHNISHASC